MRTVTSIIMLTILTVSASGAAQERKDDKKSVEAETDLMLAPSERDLSDDDRERLKSLLDEELGKAVERCVAKYPRPEFFATLLVQFQLKKSGEIRGGYVPSGAVDSNLYVKSDEERTKLEAQGSFTRLVVRSDRELERCLEKGTRAFQTGIGRVSAKVNANYGIKWKGKKATLEATSFEVSR